jgi:preprotein translocase subunit SecE
MLRVRVLLGLLIQISNKDLVYMKIVSFFKECVAELKKVVWPGKDDVISSVKVVLISTVIIAVILGLLDLLFVTGMNLIF